MPARTTLRPPKLSVEDAAALEGVSPRTIRRRIADGSLPAVRLGPRLIRINPADLDRLAHRIPAAGSGPA